MKSNNFKKAVGVLLLLSTVSYSQFANAENAKEPDIKEILKQLEQVKNQVSVLEKKLAKAENKNKIVTQSSELPKPQYGGNLESKVYSLEARLKEQEAKTEEVSAQAALAQRLVEVEQEKSVGNAEKFATTELGRKGLKITSPDKFYELGLNGYFQFDNRQFLDDEGNSGRDDLLARRLRPVIQGKAGKASFRLMPDFVGSAARVFDAHADYAFTDAVKARFGKFKTPVGLERLQSATDLSFIERGHPTNLAPTRDFGFQLYGDIIPSVLEYQLGVFNGNADLANTDNDEDDKKDFAGRIFTHPFANSDTVALQGLGVGVAGSVGDREGASSKTILGTYKTPGQQDFFRYRSSTTTPTTENVYASGKHTRFYPQGYWYYNNFGLLAEYAVSNQKVTRNTVSDTLKHKAWQVAGSYVITGENVSFKTGIKPFKDFSAEKEGWGAFEAVARVGETIIDDDAFPNFATITTSAKSAKTGGVGLNWYLSENVKLALNYEQTKFDGGATTGNRSDEKALLSRVQFRF